MSWLQMDLVRDQRRDLSIDMTPEKCKDATFIVTGANIGLGLETCRHLVRLGSKKVILAVRNMKAGEEALRDIETSTNRKGVAEVWNLDLGDYNSVKAFAKKANETLDRLDGLIENASIALDKWSLAGEHETTIAVNVYGTFLLAVLLLPKLKETGRKFNMTPHLVVVASSYAFEYQGEVDGLQKGGLDSLDSATSKMAPRYGVSKMIQIFGVRELAKKYPVAKTGVVINVLSPGLVSTGLTRRLGFMSRLMIGIFRFILARTAEMGSRTELHALAAGEETHGVFLDHCRNEDKSLPFWMTNEAGKKLQTKLWDEIVRELQKVEPGCFEKVL